VITAIHHIQLAMPRGREDDARAFYCGVLGLTEIPKPENDSRRGGAWFFSGSANVHLGVEDDFRPARKAHPALLVDDVAAIEKRCKAAGVEVAHDTPLAGFERLFVYDVFGNRIELLQPVTTVRAMDGDREVAVFAARLFREAYGAVMRKSDIDSYITQHYSASSFAGGVLLLEHGGERAGFAQLKPGAAPPGISLDAPVELGRFYVDRRFHGSGLARQLMDAVIDAAKSAGGKNLWLAVWQHNHRAIHFYEKNGFRKTGTMPFILGSDIQTDDVMLREL
jgi:ribosomal protein S18 acetylase RimI-like enzyme